MLEIHISKADAGMRLDRYLEKRWPAFKKSAMHKALRNKKIKINRKRAQADQRLNENDSILIFLPPSLLEPKEGAGNGTDFSKTSSMENRKQHEERKPVKMPEILAEGNDVIALFKPAGVLSQKDEGSWQETINERLQAWLQKERAQTKDSVFVPAVLGRLDRNTSGIMLAGLNPKSAAALNTALADHKIGKHYLALACGKVKEGPVLQYMKKEGTKARVQNTPSNDPEYKEARMHLKVLDYDAARDLSLVEVELITGRFHQIRAGLAALGHPVYADGKYGKAVPGLYQQLQAARLDLSGLELEDFPEVIDLPKDKKISLHPFVTVHAEKS